jgi:hypothetical protein
VCRYLSLFTPLLPTVHTIAAHHFTTNPTRIRDIRPDTLAQLLSHSNVSPGSRVLVADSTAGLVTAGILERLGGSSWFPYLGSFPRLLIPVSGVGTCLHIHESITDPSLPVLKDINLPAHITDGTLRLLHWAATEPEWRHVNIPLEPENGVYKYVWLGRFLLFLAHSLMFILEITEISRNTLSGD